jgi:hypothetical protein
MYYNQGCQDYLTPGGTKYENFKNSGEGRVHSSDLMDNFFQGVHPQQRPLGIPDYSININNIYINTVFSG